jgi:hypothetical protein
VSFNEALIALLAGNKGEALSKLTHAKELSPREIKRYFRASVLFDSVKSDPNFVALFDSV